MDSEPQEQTEQGALAPEPALNRIVRMTREQVEEELSLYTRTPFRNILAEFLECAPTPEAIRHFANASPDKWAIALKAVATLYGYTEKTEVTHDIRISVSRMSDAELLQRASELRSVLTIQPDNARPDNPRSDNMSKASKAPPLLIEAPVPSSS